MTGIDLSGLVAVWLLAGAAAACAPPSMPTAAATPAPHVVTGSIEPVHFFSGRPGTTIQVTVNLGVSSPAGEVREMRV